MKKVSVFILFITLNAGAQTVFNPDSVRYHFMNILNDYRVSHGLSPITLNNSLKEFADNHAAYMLANAASGTIEHSIVPLANNDRNEFRKVLDKIFKPNAYFFENCSKEPIYEKTPNAKVSKHPNPEFKISEESLMNVQKMLDYGPTNKLVAQSAFLGWKFSPSHNEALLSDEIKSFYLSYSNTKIKSIVNHYFFEFVAVNY